MCKTVPNHIFDFHQLDKFRLQLLVKFTPVIALHFAAVRLANKDVSYIGQIQAL